MWCYSGGYCLDLRCVYWLLVWVCLMLGNCFVVVLRLFFLVSNFWLTVLWLWFLIVLWLLTWFRALDGYLVCVCYLLVVLCFKLLFADCCLNYCFGLVDYVSLFYDTGCFSLFIVYFDKFACFAGGCLLRLFIVWLLALTFCFLWDWELLVFMRVCWLLFCFT